MRQVVVMVDTVGEEAKYNGQREARESGEQVGAIGSGHATQDNGITTEFTEGPDKEES